MKTDLLPISEKKAGLLNSFFFANQCSFIKYNSVLPTDYKLFTDKSFSNITFTDNDTRRKIRDLDPNKAHGHDIVSLCAKDLWRFFLQTHRTYFQSLPRA